jgi:hypothetical protein
MIGNMQKLGFSNVENAKIQFIRSETCEILGHEIIICYSPYNWPFLDNNLVPRLWGSKGYTSVWKTMISPWKTHKI